MPPAVEFGFGGGGGLLPRSLSASTTEAPKGAPVSDICGGGAPKAVDRGLMCGGACC
jgi:hypothetical protein